MEVEAHSDPCHRVVLTAGAGAAHESLRVDGSGGLMQRRPLHMAMVRRRGPTSSSTGTASMERPPGSRSPAPRPRTATASGSSEESSKPVASGNPTSDSGRHGVSRGGAARFRCRRRRSPLGDLPRRPCRGGAGPGRTRATLKRPEDATVTRTGDLVVAWPTKMVLAPRCADLVADELGPGGGVGPPPFSGLPAPSVALPPWETATWS